MSGRRSRFGYAVEALTTPKEVEVKPQPEGAEKIEVLALPAMTALHDPAAFALPAQRRGRRTEDGTVKRTDVPREQLNVRIRPELKRAAAGLAGLQGMTLGDVVEAALIAYLKGARQGED